MTIKCRPCRAKFPGLLLAATLMASPQLVRTAKAGIYNPPEFLPAQNEWLHHPTGAIRLVH